MVWVKRKEIIGKGDSKIVKEGFIIAEGSTNQFSYCNEDYKSNPFAANFRTPIFYLFNVHRNHPMHLFSSFNNHISIYPLKDRESKRMPARVYEDRMAYDLATLVLFLYDFPIEQDSKTKKILTSESGFQKTDSTKSVISLFYVEHGMCIHCQDQIKVSMVMPSNIPLHIYDWLSRGHNIRSYKKETSEFKLEGRIELSLNEARDNTWKITKILEERFKTRLTSD